MATSSTGRKLSAIGSKPQETRATTGINKPAICALEASGISTASLTLPRGAARQDEAGDGPCAVLAIGAREHIDADCHGGAYTVDEVALRHGAGVEEETSDAELAYARFPETKPTPYRDGWLPS
jgi:hypothetical protein